MKKLHCAFVVGALGALVVLTVPSCGILGGMPTNVQLGADNSGVGVMVVWTAPAEGTPDKYIVEFRPVGDTAFQPVAETTATSVFHDPEGMTGSYRVSAQFGGDVYEAEELPTTEPVHTTTVTLAELDAPGNAGFGWDRNSGSGGSYSMLTAGSADYVDFYITDFAVGSNRLPYTVASPNRGPGDEAGLVPDANWRTNGLTDSMPTAWAGDTLPEISPNRYFDYTPIDATPAEFGFYSVSDEHYGLIRVSRVDQVAAEVDVEAWFQLIPRLRLVSH